MDPHPGGSSELDAHAGSSDSEWRAATAMPDMLQGYVPGFTDSDSDSSGGRGRRRMDGQRSAPAADAEEKMLSDAPQLARGRCQRW